MNGGTEQGESPGAREGLHGGARDEPGVETPPAADAGVATAAQQPRPEQPPRAAERPPAEQRAPVEPLDPAEADRIFRHGVALFNQVRYWHAHEEWERLWRAAGEDERDFYQGLIQVAAGLLHLQRRNARGARNKLTEGIAKLRRFQPRYRGIVVDELLVIAMQILDELEAGGMPYLAPPPLIKYS